MILARTAEQGPWFLSPSLLDVKALLGGGHHVGHFGESWLGFRVSGLGFRV